MVTLCKNREFSAESAIQRLSLLRNLSDLPGRELSDRERQMYLEHILPPDQEQASRAVGGLLAYLQRTDVGSSMNIARLERCRLDKHFFLSPETFLSLGIFADRLHPSAHGGRAREGHFSVWAKMNKTRSRPGARMLRGWFAQPSQDAELLRERHDTISVRRLRLEPSTGTQAHPATHASGPHRGTVLRRAGERDVLAYTTHGGDWAVFGFRQNVVNVVRIVRGARALISDGYGYNHDRALRWVRGTLFTNTSALIRCQFVRERPC